MATTKTKKVKEVPMIKDVGIPAESVGTDETQADIQAEESVKVKLAVDQKSVEALTADTESDLHKDRILKQSGERNWYVIHTYAGYEEQVADNLKQRIESLNMSDRIFDVIVPKEKQIEIKNGKRKTVEKRIFPGYVLVDMVVTDDTWYVVRNTPNVTGFIGFGVRPTPMSKEEVDRIKKRMGVEEPKYKIELIDGDLVRITDGALKGFEGKVEDVDHDRGKIKVSVNMFGRETPVNLDFLQVKKI